MLNTCLAVVRRIVANIDGDPSVSLYYDDESGGIGIQVNIYDPKTQGFFIHSKKFSPEYLTRGDEGLSLIDSFINECNDRIRRVYK